MVLYYSASGNTEYIAKLIAKALDDECLDLQPRIKNKDYTKVYSEKPFVICAPVYVCEMPRFVSDYIKRLPFRGSRKVCYVFTSGGYAGMAGLLAETMTRRKNMISMGYAELTMPSNHIVSNAYPETSPEECRRRIAEATVGAGKIASAIKHGRRLKARHVMLWERLVIPPSNSFWVKFMMPSKDFYATEKCIGCGKCSRDCPVNNITRSDKRPVWNAPCAHCMACISNCPLEAIEYADITQHKEKYHIRKYI